MSQFVIAVAIVAPAVFVGHNIVTEAGKAVKKIQSSFEDGNWQKQLASVLALTDAILEIWCRRTAHGRPAEAAVGAPPSH